MAREARTNTKMIKKYMIDNDISSIHLLSQKTGINRNTLGRILSGKKQPGSYVMFKLMDILHIPHTEIGTVFFDRYFT